MVIRERCRSGCTGGGRTNHPLRMSGDTKFAVTCHRACYPRCLHVFLHCRHAAQHPLRRPYRRVFGRFVLGALAGRGCSRARRTAGNLHAASSTAGDFGYRTTTVESDDQRIRQFGGCQPDDRSNAKLRIRQLNDGHHRRRHREPSIPDRSGCIVARSRPQRRANRRTGRPDFGIHTRDQFQPRQGFDRRHRRFRSQQSQSIVRFRPAVDRRYCPHRGAARAAKRSLRLRRDRRRHFDHDQTRLRAT